jgi:putative PIG3 family NAD(P)H quinone oxidoreductase
MRAIEVVGQGKEARLSLGEAPEPPTGPGELRVAVCAAGINRGDLMQRRGLYPPPPGASPILGLECSGRVEQRGAAVRGFEVGERVMALLPGGGYAERVSVDAGSVLRVPETVSLIEAAGIPEVFLTCHLTLFLLGGVGAGATVLVHGGGSGIGTAAIQLLRAAGARVLVTAGSEEKCARCRELGAELALNYRSADFAPAVLEATGGLGVDFVLDHVGGAYLERNLRCLAQGGRLLLIGAMEGARAEIDLGRVLGRHLSIIGSTLRSRPLEQKAALVESFAKRFGADLASRRIRAVIDSVVPLAQAQAAHDRLEASAHFGKIVLQVAPE